MKNLSDTLLAAQKKNSSVPYVAVTVTNRIAGVIRLAWTKIYTGSEPDYMYAATMPGDGSFIRLRLTPPGDGSKLYRQRVAVPGGAADFSQWEYTGYYGVLAAGCCSLNNNVSLFWIDADRKIMHAGSTDCGATWSTPEIIDYAISTAVYGLAAACSPAGELALFFIDQSDLYIKKYAGGQWQNITPWDKAAGDLSGATCTYDSDWNILLTGKDLQGNYKLWSIVYGDGGEIPAGTWSPLTEMASAPSGGSYEFRNPCLDKPDIFRCFYNEIFTGVTPYRRPFWSHSIPSASFPDGLWREPVPFNSPNGYSLGLTHFNNKIWLSCSCGVWVASLEPQILDLSADVIALKEDLNEGAGKLIVSLRNDDGRYNSPGEGLPAILNTGCQVDFRPGYRTVSGNETGIVKSYALETFEYFTGGGKAGFILYAFDGWEALQNWRARYQFRWNAGSAAANVRRIVEFILARVGIRFEVISQSDIIDSFYPDFTIQPGDPGAGSIRQLLSFVPDRLFIEGNTAYLLDPKSDDGPVYGYGTVHGIIEGRYRWSAMRQNRIQVEGCDDNSG